MFDRDREEAPLSVRGWLSDIYFPVLVDGSVQMQQALLRRLGGKATLDDPIFGRSSGLASVERFIRDMCAWLRERGASFQRTAFTMGVEQDVTEGYLTWGDHKGVVPMAVVAERRPSREVELRVYYAAVCFGGAGAQRSQLVPDRPELPMPPAIAPFWAALLAGDADGAVDCFETDGSFVRADGTTARGPEELRSVLAGISGGGMEWVPGAFALDRRTIAFEHTLVRVSGKSIAARGALAVHALADSGKLEQVRVYHELDGN